MFVVKVVVVDLEPISIKMGQLKDSLHEYWLPFGYHDIR